MSNHFDPETFYSLAKACGNFDNDPALRAAVLIGQGEPRRGNNVEVPYLTFQYLPGLTFVKSEPMAQFGIWRMQRMP